MKARALAGPLLALLATGTAFSQDSDEFGLKPDAPHDEELVLPDPVLDRSWPMPEPGAGGAPPAVAPDEDEIDPFAEERPAAPPPGGQEEREEEELDEGAEEEYVPPPPAPVPAPDPFLPPILEPEVQEPAGLGEQDEPSPLDLDEQRYREESADPGE